MIILQRCERQIMSLAPLQTPLSREIRRHRSRLQLTQREFAQRSGYSMTYLSRMENGFCAPTSKELLDKLADALCLDGLEREALVRAAENSRTLVPIPEGVAPDAYVAAHFFVSSLPRLPKPLLACITEMVAAAVNNEEENLCP